jgi:hypothetical protein
MNENRDLKIDLSSSKIVSELLQSGNQTASQNIKRSTANSDNKDVKAALQEQPVW